jgi:hypothetical protein
LFWGGGVAGIFFAVASAAETKAGQESAPLKVKMGTPGVLSWAPSAYPKEATDQELEGRGECCERTKLNDFQGAFPRENPVACQ